jgi:hypothetical protein
LYILIFEADTPAGWWFDFMFFYVHEYSLLAQAPAASRRKIFVFISAVFIIVFVLGTVM